MEYGSINWAYMLTLIRLRGPITPGLSVYASSIPAGPLAGVNFSVSALFLDGLTLEDGLLLTKNYPLTTRDTK